MINKKDSSKNAAEQPFAASFADDIFRVCNLLSKTALKINKAYIAFDCALGICYSFIALARRMWQDVS